MDVRAEERDGEEKKEREMDVRAEEKDREEKKCVWMGLGR